MLGSQNNNKWWMIDHEQNESKYCYFIIILKILG